ncbi:protein of unknown function [Bradyrhizobium vignae]|uniref:Uncharacterized protein n=1 Tax=Bradyrhizobium vignae TaxID=1549949 RepID=A0A2U3PUS4_9BRAD|nr:protein of unknown function [Bradyrhizobium vignae]
MGDLCKVNEHHPRLRAIGSSCKDDKLRDGPVIRIKENDRIEAAYRPSQRASPCWKPRYVQLEGPVS